MGWISSLTRRKTNMIRFWNRLISIDDSRLTKKIFNCDFSICYRNWSSEVKNVLSLTNNIHNFHQKLHCDLETVKVNLHNQDCEQWSHDVYTKPKLRTYRIFKSNFETEHYIKSIYNRQHRSILAQLRCGILPLALETRRYTNIAEQDRLCLLCDRGEIDSEIHFLLTCPKYDGIRQEYFTNVSNEVNNFRGLNENEQLITLMSDKFVKTTARFIHDCYEVRRHSMYTDS